MVEDVNSGKSIKQKNVESTALDTNLEAADNALVAMENWNGIKDNGVTVTIDMINDSPNKIKILNLRSFGESLYHSLTDSCLEFGYKNI